MTNEELARVEALAAQNAELRAALEKYRGYRFPSADDARIAESLERMRAEAGRERAVRELEALMEQLKEEGFTFESQSAGLAGFGHSVAASAIGLCRVKIGRRLEEIAKEGK